MHSVVSCTINFSGKVYSNPLLDFVSPIQFCLPCLILHSAYNTLFGMVPLNLDSMLFNIRSHIEN